MSEGHIKQNCEDQEPTLACSGKNFGFPYLAHHWHYSRYSPCLFQSFSPGSGWGLEKELTHRSLYWSQHPWNRLGAEYLVHIFPPCSTYVQGSCPELTSVDFSGPQLLVGLCQWVTIPGDPREERLAPWYPPGGFAWAQVTQPVKVALSIPLCPFFLPPSSPCYSPEVPCFLCCSPTFSSHHDIERVLCFLLGSHLWHRNTLQSSKINRWCLVLPKVFWGFTN